MEGSNPRQRGRNDLLSRDFLLVCAASLLNFLGMSLTAPVFPRFVRLELGQSDRIVGLIAGSVAIGSIISRPLSARLVGYWGTRMLTIVGNVVCGLGMLGHALADSPAQLVPVRILMGIGQATFFVGATTMAMDLAPAHRRGEATSLVFVGPQIGLALGPLLGEAILGETRYRPVWVASASAMFAAGAVCLVIGRQTRGRTSTEPARWYHPAGLGPGLVLGIGQLGFIGFNTFVALYGRELGMGGIAPVLLLLSAIVVVIRFFGASLPDRLGSVTGTTVALTMSATGLVVVGAWHAVSGLYVGTVPIAIGSAFLFTSLASAATAGVADHDRAAAVATFTLFLDLCVGVSPVLNGAMAEAFSYRTMFIVSGAYALTALAILHVVVAPRLRRVA